MKKLLLSLAVLAAGAIGAQAAETSYTIEFKCGTSNNGTAFTTSTSISDVISEGAAYISGIKAATNASSGVLGMKIGQNKTAGDITFTLAEEIQPTKIEIVAGTSKNATYQKLSFNGTAVGDFTADNALGSSTTVAEGKEYKTFTVNNFTSKLSEFKFEKTNASSISSQQGFIYIKSVTVYYEGVEKADPEIKFAEETYSATIGQPFESPKATTLSDGAVTYSSSNPNAATVDAETGDVTLVGAGATVITAKVAATDTYTAGSASYTLTVTDPAVPFISAWGESFELNVNNTGEKNPWQQDTKYGLKGSAYIKGEVYATNAIAASPVIDLTGKTNIKLNFDQAFNQYKVNNEMIAPEEFDGYASVVVKEEGDTDWTDLNDAITKPTEFSWTYYANEPVSLNAYKGKKIQFGFRYVSTTECAGTWEIKNIKMTADVETGIAEIEAADDAEAVYYNLQGVRVANPENGIYIVRKGSKTTKVIL